MRTAAPPFPRPIAHLWRWFGEILAGSPSGWGPARVTWEGLAAWSALTGVRPAPREVRLLVELGAVRAEIVSEEATKSDAAHGSGA